MKFNDHLIPAESGHAVSKGWTSYSDHEPKGVTWHWTATWDLKTCRRILGGENASRKGKASAHFGVGRSREEGVDRYVKLENRSWHAGKNQTLRWDGRDSRHQGKWWSGARTTIGIETVNIGYARRRVKAGEDWIEAWDPSGRQKMLVQPWPEEQIEMMIELGKYIQERFPHLTWQDHHGHHDICPGYKVDVAGFPMARILRGIYCEHVPDIWTQFWDVELRQRALVDMGYYLGKFGPNKDGVDGDWGRASEAALSDFQTDAGLVVNGYWTQSVSLAAHHRLIGNQS